MLDSVATLFANYGPLIFLVLLFLCSFGLPVAKSLVVASGGVLAVGHPGQSPLLLISCCLGLHLGDLTLFLLGRSLGREGLRRRPFNRILPDHLVDQAERFIDQNGTSSLLLARITPFIRGPLYFLLGSLGMHQLRFNLINLATALCYTLVFFALGVQLGHRQDQLLALAQQCNLWLALTLLLLASLLFWRRRASLRALYS